MADRSIDDLLAGLPDAVQPSAEFEARLRAHLRDELSVRRSMHVTNPDDGLPNREVIELQTIPPPTTRSSERPSGARFTWLGVAAAMVALLGLAAIAFAVTDDPETPASEVPVTTAASTSPPSTTSPPATTSPTTMAEVEAPPAASGFATADIEIIPVDLERNPYFVAVGSTPWVATLDGELARLDPSTGQISETLAISESSPMVADQHGLWVADALTGAVQRLDPDTGATIATIPTGLPIVPNSVRFPMLEGMGRSFASIGGIGTDGASVWVGDQRGAVLRIDPATNTVAQTIDVPIRADHVRSDGQYLLVASPRRGEVAVIDAATGVVVFSETYPDAIAGAELFGGAVYVQDTVDGIVRRVDLATDTETESEPLGPSVVRNQEPTLPTGLVVTEDGLLAATANEPDSLHVLDPGTLVEVGTLEVPPDQGDLTIGADGSAWLVRTRDNTVIRLTPHTSAP